VRALALPALLLAATAAFAETVDEDLAPGGTVLSTVFPADEVETYRLEAPAGCTLKVDLAPLGRRAGFLPSLEATLPGGDPAEIPAARKGRTRAKLTFDVDGVLELRVSSADGSVGDYRLRTKLKGPKAVSFEGTVDSGAPAEVVFRAPPGSVAAARVKAAAGSDLVPRILSLEGPSGDVSPESDLPGPRSDSWSGLGLDALGPWTLQVGGEGESTGGFAAKVKWKPARGTGEDHRDANLPETLDGSYGSFLFAPASGDSGAVSLLAGGVDFDGEGRATTALETDSLVPDLASPFGFTLQRDSLPEGEGTYRTDGTRAAVSLDLGDAGDVSADFTVAAGGDLLYTDPAAAAAAVRGLLLRRTEVPAAADLAGQWLYVNTVTGEAGTSTVEIGTLSLGSSGAASGLGASTDVALDGNGAPVLGTQTPILRLGTFTVAADGTVTITTTQNLFGPTDTWTARLVFREDAMAGGGPPESPASEARVLLRQGTGLTDADVAGQYLHLGVATGTTLALRTGLLAFDGAGGFSGTETVVDLAGGGAPETGVATTGTYSVQTTGIATLAFDGGAGGTGIVGPDADYLFSVSLGSGGLGVDFVLSLESPSR
jgi:hypothetical protein